MDTTHFRIPHLKGRELPLEKDWGVYDAEWIALVCLHSGVFTREQYRAYFDATFMRARCFVQRLVDRKVAVEEKLPVLWGRPGWICRISHKGIYRALGVPDIRHRRKADAATTYRRLISLDYVIQNMGHQWLPTEAEKLAAFVGSMGVDRAQLPQRIYGGALANRRAYFPDQDADCPASRDPRLRICLHRPGRHDRRSRAFLGPGTRRSVAGARSEKHPGPGCRSQSGCSIRGADPADHRGLGRDGKRRKAPGPDRLIPDLEIPSDFRLGGSLTDALQEPFFPLAVPERAGVFGLLGVHAKTTTKTRGGFLVVGRARTSGGFVVASGF